VTVNTVRRWIRAGELAALLPGGTKTGYRIRRAALDQFIDQHYGRAGKDKAAA
jgi:excisionase family DNA binding protein